MRIPFILTEYLNNPAALRRKDGLGEVAESTVVYGDHLLVRYKTTATGVCPLLSAPSFFDLERPDPCPPDSA